MPRAPEEKVLVDAIIDGELDAAALAAEAAKAGPKMAQQLQSMARNLVRLRETGRINMEQAEALWVAGYTNLSLAYFAEHAGKVLKLSDESMQRTLRETAKLRGRVAQVGAIRSADIKERENERAGAVDEAGALGEGS